MSTAVSFPSSTVRLTVTSPPKPCSVAEKVSAKAEAMPSSISAARQRDTSFFMVYLLSFS